MPIKSFALGLSLLLSTLAQAGGHAPLPLAPISNKRPVVPVVAKPDNVSVTVGHLDTAGKYISPRLRTWGQSFEFCAGMGERMPNKAEIAVLLPKYRASFSALNLEEDFIWSATRENADKLRYFAAETKKDAEIKAWWMTPAASSIAKAVCLSPKNPQKEIVEMCPVGNMNYCDSFKCGSYALAFSRCLQNRMGRKSWQVYNYCRPKLSNNLLRPDRVISDSQAHASNLVAFPSLKPGMVRYCLVEPQAVYPGNEHKTFTNCWDGKYVATPRVPLSIQIAACDDTDRVPYFSVHPAGTIHMGNGDYTESDERFESVVRQTGISGHDLLPSK